MIEEVYKAVLNGPSWERTLLVITYDEHGGCYDHVPPPTTAVPPDGFIGSSGFDFRRFGVRVPAVLVSPYIDAGTILRPPGHVVFDHTSIIETLRRRFGITKPLTHRDDAAPSFEMVLARSKPRNLDEVPEKFGVKGALQAKRAAIARADREPLNELQRNIVQMAANLPPKGTRPNAKRLAAAPVRESVDEVSARAATQRAAEDYVVQRLQEAAGRSSRRRGVPA